MSVDSQEFRVVLRGYEPAQVDALRQALQAQLDEADSETLALRKDPSIRVETPQASFSRRLTTILELAEEEATEIRQTAAENADQLRADVELSASQLREEADAYATKRTDEAEAFARKLVTDAEETATKTIAAATREADEMRQAASTLLDDQKTKAAAVAAEFERDVEARRNEAEAKFRAVIDDHQTRMHDLDEHLEKRRVEGERRHQEALSAARAILEDAHNRADSIIADAAESAENLRVESENEVAIITKQRDEINAQLGNVREMLASLTGGSLPADPMSSTAE